MRKLFLHCHLKNYDVNTKMNSRLIFRNQVTFSFGFILTWRAEGMETKLSDAALPKPSMFPVPY